MAANKSVTGNSSETVSETSDTGGSRNTSMGRSGDNRRPTGDRRQGHRSDYQSKGAGNPEARGAALEVTVENNIDRAMKILKRKLIKEGLFKELKLRRYYEKPSERKKRKLKESLKKARKEEARQRKNAQLFS